MKRILIVEVNWVGDVLFSTPFIRSVREAYPDSYIACLLHPRTREVLESNPCLDEIIIYDEKGAHRGLFGKLRLIMALRKKNFGTAFILHRSFTKALITCLAGIGERIGYHTKKRSVILTRSVDEPAIGAHKVEYFLAIAEAVGIKARSRSYEFIVTEADRKFIDELLAEKGVARPEKIVVINPGGNWDPKRWPKENFAKLADRIAEALNARIVISGSVNDIALAEDIRRLMKAEPVIVAGRTTLKQLGALLSRSNLVVANDSGPMHMAVAVGAKVIALFGPTSPGLTGPYGDGDYTVIFKNKQCDVPCYDNTCTDNSCMAAISVEDVMAEATRKIDLNL